MPKNVRNSRRITKQIMPMRKKLYQSVFKGCKYLAYLIKHIPAQTVPQPKGLLPT